MTDDQIRRWRERAEKIHNNWNMGEAIKLAEEIDRWGLDSLKSAAVFFLGQAKRRDLDVGLSAPRNSFSRLLTILREEESRSP
jgi:hypothetical protein